MHMRTRESVKHTATISMLRGLQSTESLSSSEDVLFWHIRIVCGTPLNGLPQADMASVASPIGGTWGRAQMRKRVPGSICGGFLYHFLGRVIYTLLRLESGSYHAQNDDSKGIFMTLDPLPYRRVIRRTTRDAKSTGALIMRWVANYQQHAGGRDYTRSARVEAMVPL